MLNAVDVVVAGSEKQHLEEPLKGKKLLSSAQDKPRRWLWAPAKEGRVCLDEPLSHNSYNVGQKVRFLHSGNEASALELHSARWDWSQCRDAAYGLPVRRHEDRRPIPLREIMGQLHLRFLQ
jgi:hypothetical protein